MAQCKPVAEEERQAVVEFANRIEKVVKKAFERALEMEPTVHPKRHIERGMGETREDI